jgi:hypothetical protein
MSNLLKNIVFKDSTAIPLKNINKKLNEFSN